MLRRKKESMEDMPKDVRHSLEFLDNLLDQLDEPPPALNPSHVPADVRKSLEILDSVLGEYEDDGVKRSRSTHNLRSSDEVPDEVSKSLEVLDQVLDEFQKENGQDTHRRRRPPQRGESTKKNRHDDVRRSLEVLDSVLAEFDDCLEAWDTIGQHSTPPDENFGNDKLKDFVNDRPVNGKISSTTFSYDSRSVDGDTSHDSGLSLQEQTKIASPPPIPKRSATTKLSVSDRNSGLFNFQLADSHSFDSLQSESSSVPDNDASLSTISILSSAKDDDEVFGNNSAPAVHCCANCGREVEIPVMEKEEREDVSSSPFLERRKIFEVEPSSNVSSLLERSFTGSSFKVRTKDSESEPSSLVLHHHRAIEMDRNDFGQSSFTSKYSPKATKVSPPRVDGLLTLAAANLHHAPNCNCKERIKQLQMKFAETRRLLKANKIKGLDLKPPSFVPPPPPPEVMAKNVRNETKDCTEKNSNGLSDDGLVTDSKNWRTCDGSPNSDSISSEENCAHSLSISSTDSVKNVPNIVIRLERKLCRRCSKSSDHLPLSETIEDLPKLLPTDALKRPHLGLSYSLEDDLCPGVKEILQTSTPRNALPLSRIKKTNSLSTFSLSDTSLGYVSSQSDFELNNSPMKVDKVPVSTIKFKTLPEGMDLHSLPSYYGQDGSVGSDPKSGRPLYRDRNFNHTSDPQMRSSSAPPQPLEEAEEKPKKKHFRAFSRKEKKKKNEDSISLTSHLSLDDRLILKSIDGDTNTNGAADRNVETGVEKKRWSALRSILGRR